MYYICLKTERYIFPEGKREINFLDFTIHYIFPNATLNRLVSLLIEGTLDLCIYYILQRVRKYWQGRGLGWNQFERAIFSPSPSLEEIWCTKIGEIAVHFIA